MIIGLAAQFQFCASGNRGFSLTVIFNWINLPVEFEPAAARRNCWSRSG
jgi:Zn-dependent membrane protease YugP